MTSASDAVFAASCHDARHPPSAIVDAGASSFWVTTGGFPQEFILELRARAHANQSESWQSTFSTGGRDVTRVRTTTTGVQRLAVESCRASGPNTHNWRPLFDVLLPRATGGGGVGGVGGVGGRLQQLDRRIAPGADQGGAELARTYARGRADPSDIDASKAVTFLKFKILSGHGDVATVHSAVVDGCASRVRQRVSSRKGSFTVHAR
jgi:hypothetical protein